ncbi:hypothetical protein BUALT_Bualt03G0007600 [Buddleja alternifolia]|uniref:DCD domain-containing protein n=1 Tax=Buddleja alternifolia TaxID=168488 RepID=A0AAV6XRM7_9LAMI|nr:hypothetical protein BUALT_Bualt03G0007600 [Buddleja alternifolia]
MGQFADCLMEYNEEDDAAAGSIPEFGAIFMSSIVTKKECFKRRIFALPSSQANFVKHVKAGMVLFLFEFEKRQLFGVYQASSDGAMDIVPHGFNYSGKHFRAQVPFTSIWSCNPLPEKEFRDAIRENYFSAKKFNFGLSEDQVRRLLYLFSSRKLQNKLPPRLPTEVVDEAAGKDRGLVDNDNFALTQRRYTEQSDYDEFNSAVSCDYQGISLTRAEEDELLIEDGVYTEGKEYPLTESFLTDYQGNFLAKRRRIDGHLRSLRNDPPKDSLEDARRLAGGRRLLSVERACNENQVDENLNHALSSEYMMGPLDVRMDIDDRLMQRNRLFKECDMGSGYGQSIAREHHLEPLDKSKHDIDDRFLFDDCVRREHNVRDIVKPLVYGDGNLNLLAQAREATEDRHCSMNGMLKNRYHMDSDGSHVLLRRIRKTTAGGRLSTNEGIESEPNLGSCSEAGFSSENFARPLHYGHRIIQDGRFPPVSGRESENMLERIGGSAVSNINSEYISSVDGRVIDDGRLRKSEKVENVEDNHALVNPVISTGYPYYSNPKHNLSSYSDKFLPEKARSQLTIAHSSDPYRSKFNDATTARAVRNISEIPNCAYGCSTSLAADRNSDLVREDLPHHGSLGNFYSVPGSRSSPQFLESTISGRYLDMEPGCGNKCLPPKTSSHRSSSLHETTNSFLNSKSHTQMELNTSAPFDYRGSFLPKPSMDHENIELDERLFAYPSKSSENHFALDGGLRMESKRMSRHVPRQEMDMLTGENFIRSEAKDYSLGIYHQERDLDDYENQYLRSSSNMNLEEHRQISEAPHFDSNAHRRSVFTRLTSGKEVHVGEERKDTPSHCHDCYMDSSADEVMEMLQQGNNLPTRELRKSRVVEQPKCGGSDLDENLIQSHVEINHSTIEKKKLMHDLAFAEGIKEVPDETRIVGFKRRSETKKNLVGTNTYSDADNKITAVNEEVEISTNKTSKRKKLVRPVFRKNESATDSTGNSQHLELLGQILHKDDKRSCQSAINTCEAKMPNEITTLSNVLASGSHQSTDFNVKEVSNAGVQKDIGADVASSTSHELEGHKTSNVGVESGVSQVLLKETTQSKSSGSQISIKGISSKDSDTTVGKLILEESSSEGPKLDGNCGGNLGEGKRFRMLKNKKKIIRLGKAGTQ